MINLWTKVIDVLRKKLYLDRKNNNNLYLNNIKFMTEIKKTDQQEITDRINSCFYKAGVFIINIIITYFLRLELIQSVISLTVRIDFAPAFTDEGMPARPSRTAYTHFTDLG